MNTVKRPLLLWCTFAVALVAVSSAAASNAASDVVIGPAKATLNPKGFTTVFAVTCPADAESDICAGVLDVDTAGPIKPYSSIAKKVWKVGAFSFTVPAGQTGQVKVRVYGGALAQAVKTGTVKLRVTARAPGRDAFGTQVVTLTMKR